MEQKRSKGSTNCTAGNIFNVFWLLRDRVLLHKKVSDLLVIESFQSGKEGKAALFHLLNTVYRLDKISFPPSLKTLLRQVCYLCLVCAKCVLAFAELQRFYWGKYAPELLLVCRKRSAIAKTIDSSNSSSSKSRCEIELICKNGAEMHFHAEKKSTNEVKWNKNVPKFSPK